MGLCVEVFVDQPDDLVTVIGCRRQDWLDWANSLPDNPFPLDDEEPSASVAAAAVINGGPYDELFAYTYHLAYKQIWVASATPLHNDLFCPCGSAYLTAVNEALAASGVSAVSLSGLLYRPVPLPLPSPPPGGEVPLHGMWSHQSCVEAFEQWERRDNEAWMAAVPERSLLFSVIQIIGWVAHAAALPGAAVAAFMG